MFYDIYFCFENDNIRLPWSVSGYQVGGKSLMWARETQRWSRFEFEAPERDRFAVDWPIRYEDLAPWYSHVEKFAGISGNKDGIENLPDGEFLPPWEFNCAEKLMQQKANSHLHEQENVDGPLCKPDKGRRIAITARSWAMPGT